MGFLRGVISVALASASATLAAKRGLAWPSSNTQNPNIFSSPNINWLYDWGMTPPSNLGNSFPFVPMQWNAANIQNLASELSSAGEKVILGFNEPDNGGQANMSPASAASYWKQYIQPLKAQGVKIVSPAFTNGGPPSGVAWFQQFLGNCTGCTFDAIACHWYGGWTTDLEAYIESVKAAAPGYPIWLTEWALSWGTPAAQESNYLQFLPLALQYLDGEPSIERYAFFGAFYDGQGWDLLGSNNSLNALGQIYVSSTYPTSTATSAPPSTTTSSPPPASSLTPGNFYIQASNGQYVTASSSNLNLIANAGSTSAATIFTLAYSGGYWTIYSTSNAQFVTADISGNYDLEAARTTASTWEEYTITSVATGAYTIQALSNNDYVTLASNGGLTNNGAASSSAAVLKFIAATTAPVTVSPGNFYLQVGANFVVSTASNTNLIASATSKSAGTVFTLAKNSAGQWTIWDTSNSQYVTADISGNYDLASTRGTASTWEYYNLISSGSGYLIQAVSNNDYITLASGGGLVNNGASTSAGVVVSFVAA